MTIEKGELILGIISLFDELEAAKQAARNVETVYVDKDGEGLSQTDLIMLQAGRREVYKDCLYSWIECDASRDEETGAIKVTPYDTWLKKKVRKVPNYMSRVEFYDYFADRLTEDYEREKQDAIAKLAVTGEDQD